MADAERQLAVEGAQRLRVAALAVASGLLFFGGQLWISVIGSKEPTIGLLQGLAPAFHGLKQAAVDPRTIKEQFLVHHQTTLLIAAFVISGIGVLMMIGPLRYLAAAERLRSPTPSPLNGQFALAGPILYGVVPARLRDLADRRRAQLSVGHGPHLHSRQCGDRRRCAHRAAAAADDRHAAAGRRLHHGLAALDARRPAHSHDGDDRDHLGRPLPDPADAAARDPVAVADLLRRHAARLRRAAAAGGLDGGRGAPVAAAPAGAGAPAARGRPGAAAPASRAGSAAALRASRPCPRPPLRAGPRRRHPRSASAAAERRPRRHQPAARGPSTNGSRTPRSGRSSPSGACSASISASGTKRSLERSETDDHRDEGDRHRHHAPAARAARRDSVGLVEREPDDDARGREHAARRHPDGGSAGRQPGPPDPEQEQRAEGARGQGEGPADEQADVDPLREERDRRSARPCRARPRRESAAGGSPWCSRPRARSAATRHGRSSPRSRRAGRRRSRGTRRRRPAAVIAPSTLPTVPGHAAAGRRSTTVSVEPVM